MKRWQPGIVFALIASFSLGAISTLPNRKSASASPADLQDQGTMAEMDDCDKDVSSSADSPVYPPVTPLDLLPPDRQIVLQQTSILPLAKWQPGLNRSRSPPTHPAV